MAGYWPKATGAIAELMNDLPKFVFSRTLPPPQWDNTTLVTSDAATEVRKLKRAGDRNSLVFGSANLSETLMAEGLFDEYRLLITPVILGSGKSLFGRSLPRQKLKLLDMRQLASGGVILRYEPLRGH
jgi:dihydrofolate reductase